jgi:hypothetical protein
LCGEFGKPRTNIRDVARTGLPSKLRENVNAARVEGVIESNRQAIFRGCLSTVHYVELEKTVRELLRLLEPKLYRDEMLNIYDLENVAVLNIVPLFVSKLVCFNKIKSDFTYDVNCSLLLTVLLLRNIDRAICGPLL